MISEPLRIASNFEFEADEITLLKSALGRQLRLVELFCENLRYTSGQELLNIVDKNLGF